MKNIFNIKENYFYYFIFLYFLTGVYLSLNVGITHDESHSYWVWELNKKNFLNIFFNTNYDVSQLDTYHGFYGIGFYIFSTPIEYLVNLIPNSDIFTLTGRILINKHPIVFIFFIISGIYLKNIIYLITKNRNFSFLCSILFLTYPYLLGHSFFNIKDIPFMSIWLICTYYLIIILKDFFYKKRIKLSNLFLFSFLTAYLLSIRVSGILIFIQYLIFVLVFIKVFKFEFIKFIKLFYKNIIISSLAFVIFFYLMNPNYWEDPFKFISSIKFMSQHVQTVCTLTLGECMKAQYLPSTYIPIWLFFKLPLIILFGLILFPFKEKKIFLNKDFAFLIGSLLLTTVVIIFSLILLNVNLYDELRQILFLIPIIFIISLSTLYFYSKKITSILLIIFIIFFTFQNIKIFPYNYLWLNNFTLFTKINGVFELDYWGVSTKNVSQFLNTQKISKESCIISSRHEDFKPFLSNKGLCLKPFKDLHKKNIRPFYALLIERNIKKGVPNNCKNIHNEKININFSKEDLILAKVFVCD